MICPNCGAEYVEGIFECSDCFVELIPKDDFIDEDNLDVSLADWKEVFSSNDMIEAEMIKANLRGAGIDAVIFSKEDRMRINLSYVGAAPIKLFVKENNVETAQQIIKDINETETGDDE
jgi:hypothetical protein